MKAHRSEAGATPQRTARSAPPQLVACGNLRSDMLSTRLRGAPDLQERALLNSGWRIFSISCHDLPAFGRLGAASLMLAAPPSLLAAAPHSIPRASMIQGSGRPRSPDDVRTLCLDAVDAAAVERILFSKGLPQLWILKAGRVKFLAVARANAVPEFPRAGRPSWWRKHAGARRPRRSQLSAAATGAPGRSADVDDGASGQLWPAALIPGAPRGADMHTQAVVDPPGEYGTCSEGECTGRICDGSGSGAACATLSERPRASRPAWWRGDAGAPPASTSSADTEDFWGLKQPRSRRWPAALRARAETGLREQRVGEVEDEGSRAAGPLLR